MIDVARTRWLRMFPISLLLTAVAGVGGAQERSITILHTNDMHASFQPRVATWVRQAPRPKIGGFPRLQSLIDSIRAGGSPVLLLDAGDVMTGNPICDRTYMEAEGGALFEMMNLMGYDAWSPGNHDLDISQQNLVALTRVARFPTLSANLVNDAGAFPVGNRPYLVLERGGLRIGIIGLMSQQLYGLVHQANLKGIRVLSPVETLRQYARELDARTDLLIALTHQGFSEDSLLAAAVPDVDLIVGGHSHTRLQRPRTVNGVLIVQAGSNTEYLGYARVAVEDDRIIRHDARLIPTWYRADIPRTALTVLADSMQASIDAEYSEVIGALEGDWVRKATEQSAIGTFIAEAQRTAVMANVAFMNSHGIRKDMAAGPVTKKDLYEILPFRNLLVTFQLTGEQLARVMAYRIAEKSTIQVAGMTARWKKGADGGLDLQELLVEGKAVDPRRSYTCVANDYLVGEAERYLGVPVEMPIVLNATLFDAVYAEFKRQSPVTPRVLYLLQESR
jgi:2',3'-cyclic-nucleotide 2'-phosphodiesterase (5'-nucleotidase family)